MALQEKAPMAVGAAGLPKHVEFKFKRWTSVLTAYLL